MAFTPHNTDETEVETTIVTLKEDHAFTYGTFPKGNKFNVLFYSDDQSYAQVQDAQPEDGQPAFQLYIPTSKLKGAKQAKPAPKAPTPSPSAAPKPSVEIPSTATAPKTDDDLAV